MIDIEDIFSERRQRERQIETEESIAAARAEVPKGYKVSPAWRYAPNAYMQAYLDKLAEQQGIE